MKRDEQIRVIELLMQRLDDGTNVDAGCLKKNPTDVYRNPELATREWDSFFRHHPQVLGLSADLPEPGSFLTTSDFGVPILATRDDAGGLRAFLNVCRHRGVTLETEERGNCARFTCPFHGWSYANDGSLAGLPNPGQFGVKDRSGLGLIELPAAECGGLLWVHPDANGELDAPMLLGGLEEEFNAWNFSAFRSLGTTTYRHRMNWKLGIDTFGETYHFKMLHRDSLALDFYGDVQTYDKFGRNHRMGLCKRSIDELRHEPREQWHIVRAALPVYYLFPNVQVNCLGPGVALVRLFPEPGDPARSIARVSFYLHPEAEMMDVDFRGEFEQRFGAVIRDEDFVMASRQQSGADSGAQEYVIFGRNEPALHHYHDTYRAALGMPPLENFEG